MPLRRAFWRRNALHNGLQHIGHALPGFGADQQRIGRIEADRALNHLLRTLNVGALQIDLVDDRNNFEAMIDGQVRVRERLRFNSLRCVDH